MKQVVAGVGPAALARSDITLELGAHHPSTHGSLRLRLELDGDVVVTAEPLVGALHRGAEKLFEVRDYRQVLVLANRHDWLAAFNNEVGVALAVEDLLGLEVPVRATWLRTLLRRGQPGAVAPDVPGLRRAVAARAPRGTAAPAGGGHRRAHPRRLHPDRRAARGRARSAGPSSAARRCSRCGRRFPSSTSGHLEGLGVLGPRRRARRTASPVRSAGRAAWTSTCAGTRRCSPTARSRCRS